MRRALPVMLLFLSACGGASVRYPLAEPVWVDDDRQPFAPRPTARYTPPIWDGADNAVMRPLSELFWLELDREAIDVNALDEVPDSSWFTNRLSLSPLTPEELARGACATDDAELRPPFTITRGKPDGASPGFFVRDADGITYLMKPDGSEQPERASAADVIGAAVFHAAGFWAPCNRVVLVERGDFELAPDAEVRRSSGERGPLTQDAVDEVLSYAYVAPDGRLRFTLSQFVEGEPIGPWDYQGTWGDDANDVVPHEHRRELRGMYVLSSWLSHIDSRQENTLASWMSEGESGYVRHYVIDFGDSLGTLFQWDRLSRRFGHSGYFDVQHIAEDLFTLGAVSRPWDRVTLGPAGETLGYFDVEHYRPDRWRPGYPNHAFDHMTERDAAWMARILSRISDAHLRALVARARFSDAGTERTLVRVLAGRRDRALERWLTRLSPLASPAAEGEGERAAVCLEDLAVASGLRAPRERHHDARVVRADDPASRVRAVTAEGARVCVALERVPAARAPSYVVVAIVTSSEGRETTGALHVHLYDLGAGGLRVVGLERLDPP